FPWSIRPPPTEKQEEQASADADASKAPGPTPAYYPQDTMAPFASSTHTHKVVEGDTLWNLAQVYLGGSEHWPLLWAGNKHIENPHWIYPGELVHLGAASPVFEPAAPPPAFLPKWVPKPTSSPIMVAVHALLMPGPPNGWATIESSMTQSEMLSPMDEVHLKIKEDSLAQPGDTFLILRSHGSIKHPKTRKVVGHMTQVVGAARLYSREGSNGMAQIVRATAEVLRGDMLGPPGESHLRPIYTRKNEKAMEGWVVAVEPLQASMAGGQSLIFVDKGTEDGVQLGNRFHIMRQQDGLSLETVLEPTVAHKGLPRHAVATCTVVDLRPNASACLLTVALREIVPGDSVEMREGENP
ncbi:MAG: LysM peptidoglycan-binding domain-containing protein, partial [Cystobacterineae bacterium]|nr:LysM peptidoglycan-binding domain-containing protein [Cystobacterineae bacterium]